MDYAIPYKCMPCFKTALRRLFLCCLSDTYAIENYNKELILTGEWPRPFPLAVAVLTVACVATLLQPHAVTTQYSIISPALPDGVIVVDVFAAPAPMLV
jgi:hypothetical protein